ncbi:hypothetical protein MSPP1_003349 [Malassezia sp. CBS 17886]|nr:hypothetical protein MSPP1_003349 [Malassezia sp. CBS 17886]
MRDAPPQALAPRESTLLVFVHGFKGSAEATFRQFPDRLAHLLQQTHPARDVVPLTYPTYETRGSLKKTTEDLVAWTTEQVVLHQGAARSDGPRVSVIFCGHSMGGIVALDAALAVARATPPGGVAWPYVRGVVAYDTPYLGVNPRVFKHQISTYHGYLDSAVKTGAVLSPVGGGLASMWASSRAKSAEGRASGSRMSTAAWIGVGTAAVAAMGTAATAVALKGNDSMSDAYAWLSDHALFVRNLWDTGAMAQRLDDATERRIPFHCFYTQLAPSRGTFFSPLDDPVQRTFILLPERAAPYAPQFSPLDSVRGTHGRLRQRASDEIHAHTSMFSAQTNESYFAMGLGASGGEASLTGRVCDTSLGMARHPARQGADNVMQGFLGAVLVDAAK